MKMLIVLFIFSLSSISFAQQADIERFFKDKTKLENPLELRDPFRSPQIRAKKETTSDKSTRDPEELLQNVNISDIRIQGVLVGKERRAILKLNNQDAKAPPVIIKEGYRIGPDRVEVKAILPGGVILVEKMINVYGQEEYLETVIPISK